MRAQLEGRYIEKTQALGVGPENQRQTKILNRMVTWSDKEGFGYEADPRYVDILLEQLKMEDAKPAITPGTKGEGRTSEDSGTQFSDKETIEFRAPVARCNYLVPDRLDIAFATEELARAMANPTQGDHQRLK